MLARAEKHRQHWMRLNTGLSGNTMRKQEVGGLRIDGSQRDSCTATTQHYCLLNAIHEADF